MWFIGLSGCCAVLLSVLCSIQHVYPSSALPTGGFQHRYLHGNKSYAYSSILLTYRDARLVCKATGGQLAIIRDAETNAFITNLRSRVNIHGYWVRIKDWDLHADYDLPLFSGWSNGLPKRGKSSAGKDRCPYLSPELQLDWHDADCNNASMPYICQHDNGESSNPQWGTHWNSDPLACTQKSAPCYELVHATSNRANAESDCKRRGGSLALIDTKETHDFLNSIIHEKWKQLNGNEAATSPGVKTWAGAHLSPGRWTYVDGTPLEYTNWAHGRPAESGRNAKCVTFWEGNWHPEDCGGAHMRVSYICEYPREVYPNSTNCENDKCYQYIKNDVAQGEAQEACTKNGGNLAMPKTAEINALLTAIQQQFGAQMLWVGVRATPRRFEYSDGTPLTFTAWASGKPYNIENTGEPCATINGDHKWHDAPCDEKNAFICEYEALQNPDLKKTPGPAALGVGYQYPGQMSTEEKSLLLSTISRAQRPFCTFICKV